MTDALWRLLWALPLVVLVGAAIMLALRQLLPRLPATGTHPMTVRQSLVLSDETRVHLLQVDGRSYVVMESSRNSVLQAVQAASDRPQPAPSGRPAWMRHIYMSGAR
jgi:flagellar biogenesis protein FliO